jgi:hypothetical protein
MFKYTAFDLYKTNELGAYQPAVVMAGQKSREVYLASDVDALLQKLSDARLTWAMVCDCECTGCDDLDTVIRSLMGSATK